MNFIETLKSVGGGEPCQKCEGVGQYDGPPTKRNSIGGGTCEVCHGNGTVLNLAPLLAKPSCLIDLVTSLLNEVPWSDKPGPCKAMTGKVFNAPPIYVVGPQCAHSLVYEIARQLGGSAVVTVEQHSHHYAQVGGAEVSIQPYMHQCKITLGLSLPIPPDATVLFVTDRVDEVEMASVTDSVSNPIRWLPYVLALISNKSILLGPRGAEELKIISLHQEIK